MEENKSFEACMDELETIIRQLEAGESPIADMVALYERGAKLGENCLSMLESYQSRIETLDASKEKEV